MAGSGSEAVAGSASGEGKGKGKEKQQFGPEVQELKKMAQELIREGREVTSSKWLSGVSLTEEDLLDLIRGCQS